jgi:hypothetical protein
MGRLGAVPRLSRTDRAAAEVRPRPRRSRPRRVGVVAARRARRRRGRAMAAAAGDGRAVERCLGAVEHGAAHEHDALARHRPGAGGRSPTQLVGRGGQPLPRRLAEPGPRARRLAGPQRRDRRLAVRAGADARDRLAHRPPRRAAGGRRPVALALPRRVGAQVAADRARSDRCRDRVHRRHVRRRASGPGDRIGGRDRAALRRPRRTPRRCRPPRSDRDAAVEHDVGGDGQPGDRVDAPAARTQGESW